VHTHGEPPTHTEHPDPVAGPGSSVVRVTAAPIVPLDLLCATGTSYFGAPALPYVPGVQGVGVVEQSETFDVGTRVFFATNAGMAAGDGSYAERAAVPDNDVIALPELEIEDAAVAAIGLSGVAGWMTLTWRARLQAGERVLVLGAGGAVGQVAIGAARVLGASGIVAVARSDASRDRALAAGADEVVSSSTDVEELTQRLGGPYDVVIDSVFGAAATAAARTLAPGGRLVNLGGSAGDEAVFSSSVLRSKSVSVLGYTNNALTAGQRREALTAVLEHAATGAIGVAHQSVPLADIASAWKRQSANDTPGRLVVTFT
jgi:NADPH:quinone reductase-like Zn-dependent oxidoreductase